LEWEGRGACWKKGIGVSSQLRWKRLRILTRGGKKRIGTLRVGSLNEKTIKMTRGGKKGIMNNVR